MGACCTMVKVCSGVADWVLWMMRLEPPIEVMVGTASTLTEDTKTGRGSEEGGLQKNTPVTTTALVGAVPLTSVCSPFSCSSLLLMMVAGWAMTVLREPAGICCRTWTVWTAGWEVLVLTGEAMV